jgi:hypothetical protein
VAPVFGPVRRFSFTFTDTEALTSATRSIPDPALRMRLVMSLLTCTALPAPSVVDVRLSV